MGEFEELEFEEVDVGLPRGERMRRERARGGGRGDRGDEPVRWDRPRRRMPWWPWAAGLGLVALIAGSVALAGNGGNEAATTTSRHRRSTTTTTTQEPTTTVVVEPTAIDTVPRSTFTVVTPSPTTTLPSRFSIETLPELTGLRLVARTNDTVLDIDLDAGTVERFEFPTLTSGGPVFFLAGPDWAVVRPLDFVPGWLVGRPTGTEPLANEMATGGSYYPGPFASLWRVDPGVGQMILVDADGNNRGVIVATRDTFPVAADGAFGVLLRGTGGTYDATSSGISRVTTGEVVAAGPSTFLTFECDASLSCARVIVDRGTGNRRTLVGQTTGLEGPVGSISPDGTIAAVMSPGPREGRLLLTDLVSGNVNNIGAARLEGGLVWSANSRFLFYVGIDGGLHMWDRQDPGQRYVLSLGDDNVQQVTARYG